MYTVPGIYRIRFHIRERYSEWVRGREFILMTHMTDGKKHGGAIVLDKRGVRVAFPFSFNNDELVRKPTPQYDDRKHFIDLMDKCGEPKLVVSDNDLEEFYRFVTTGAEDASPRAYFSLYQLLAKTKVEPGLNEDMFDWAYLKT